MNETEQPTRLSRAEIIRNRIKLLAIMAVFALPVLIAYMGFFGGWFQDRHTVNKGELLNPTLSLSQFELVDAVDASTFETGQHWWLLLVQTPGACDASCERQLITVRQTWLGLGKHQERVHTAVVGGEPGNQPLEQTRVLRAKGSDALPPAFYIVDPLGNIMLRYQLPQSEQDAIDRAKDMRTDFSKLLRYSRIG